MSHDNGDYHPTVRVNPPTGTAPLSSSAVPAPAKPSLASRAKAKVGVPVAKKPSSPTSKGATSPPTPTLPKSAPATPAMPKSATVGASPQPKGVHRVRVPPKQVAGAAAAARRRASPEAAKPPAEAAAARAPVLAAAPPPPLHSPPVPSPLAAPAVAGPPASPGASPGAAPGASPGTRHRGPQASRAAASRPRGAAAAFAAAGLPDRAGAASATAALSGSRTGRSRSPAPLPAVEEATGGLLAAERQVMSTVRAIRNLASERAYVSKKEVAEAVGCAAFFEGSPQAQVAEAFFCLLGATWTDRAAKDVVLANCAGADNRTWISFKQGWMVTL